MIYEGAGYSNNYPAFGKKLVYGYMLYINRSKLNAQQHPTEKSY
jgi:hypothetical protein